jgi:hypothetical protein
LYMSNSIDRFKTYRQPYINSKIPPHLSPSHLPTLLDPSETAVEI